MNLKERCLNLLSTLDLPKTRFCRKIGISTQALNAWLRDDLKLSQATEQRINEFLKKYNF